MKNHTFINLFFAVLLCEILLLLIALPGLAGVYDSSRQKSNSTLIPSTTSINPGYDTTSAPTASATPSETPVIIHTELITPTVTPSPVTTSSPTNDDQPSQIPATAILILSTQDSYLPVIYQQEISPTPTNTPTPTSSPPETVLFCDDLVDPLYIPDNNSNGVSDEIVINDNRFVVSVRLYLNITHTWVGDLVVRLSNLNTGNSITVLSRPGPEPDYCSNNDIVTILDDAAAQPVDDQCASYPHAISGIYLPTQALSSFSGASVAGTWRLNVSDHFQNDTGVLNHWCLQATLADQMPAPTPSPTPVNLPDSAYISGMSGQNQQLNLDCESRSAVDWAKHYGHTIDEIQFFNNLPTSDDPETGFVGNVNGVWGQMPPNDYGVHAPPIASLLRDYGLTAQAYRSLRWDDLRASVATGDPAIVWITGGFSYNLVNGTPYFYTASSTGNTTLVAPYEHTVVLIGYTPTKVTVLNGSYLIDVPLDQFLDSWSVLDFMAVLAHP